MKLKNREDALSIEGIEQVIVACQQLNLLNRSPTLVKYSLAASCIDTSNIVQRELKLGRDRIVPEFTFLDPRAIGKWDMMSKKQVEPAILAYDHDNAGNDGLGARPPPNDDGTPNETLNDQVIRLRQLLSILESQYSGDTILLIFPDGTGPALLSAMIAGIPFNRVHQLEYSPGEVRFDITYESTRKLYNEKNTLASQRNSVVSYEQKLAIGRKNLIELHTNNPENGGIGYINMKDEKLEKDRLEVVEAVAAKGRQRKLIEDEAENVRQQRQIQYNNENDSELNPTVFGAAGLLATAGIGLIVGRDETAESNIVYNDKTKGNVGFSSDSSNVLVTATANGAIMNMTTDSGSSLYASISQQRQRVNGDSKGLYSSPPVIVDPKVAAEKAMQEYLDRDDGADDWLQAMADIIEEPDDDDELVIDDKHNQVWNSSSFQ